MFWANQKNKMATVSDWLRHFFSSSLESLNKIGQEARSQRPQICVLRADQKSGLSTTLGGILFSGAPGVALWFS